MLNTIRAKNVLVYVADSLRYDYLPEAIAARGVTVKTVASSLLSPSSFSSLVSGLYPYHHGVHAFQNTLKTWTFFQLDGYQTSFMDTDRALPRTLDHPPKVPLAQMQPPFFYMERDLITHVPYNRQDRSYTIKDYFRDRVHSLPEMRQHYLDSTVTLVEKFNRVLETLERKGWLDDTLIIFTSDHGELLGEYGLIGHVSPACPQIVYVPTVFIHPSLPRGEKITSGVIGHADILPTALAALNVTPPHALDGENILGKPLPRCRYNEGSGRIYGSTSLWDANGGHVWYEHGWPTRLVYGVRRKLIPDPNSFKLTMLNWGVLPLMLQQHRVFGQPGFDASAALVEMERVRSGQQVTAETENLDEDVIERLRDLGYME